MADDGAIREVGWGELCAKEWMGGKWRGGMGGRRRCSMAVLGAHRTPRQGGAEMAPYMSRENKEVMRSNQQRKHVERPNPPALTEYAVPSKLKSSLRALRGARAFTLSDRRVRAPCTADPSRYVKEAVPNAGGDELKERRRRRAGAAIIFLSEAC